jgi:hypothetical protein
MVLQMPTKPPVELDLEILRYPPEGLERGTAEEASLP